MRALALASACPVATCTSFGRGARASRSRGIAFRREKGRACLWLYSAVAHGRPQEEDVEGPPRQAPRAALDRGSACERLPQLRVADTAASHVPDVQDLSRARHRAAPHAGAVDGPKTPARNAVDARGGQRGPGDAVA